MFKKKKRLLASKCKIQRRKRFRRMLFLRTTHSMRIFGVSPFFKLQKNTKITIKRRQMRSRTFIWCWLSFQMCSCLFCFHGVQCLEKCIRHVGGNKWATISIYMLHLVVLPVQFSSRWYQCAWKSPHALHPVF